MYFNNIAICFIILFSSDIKITINFNLIKYPPILINNNEHVVEHKQEHRFHFVIQN